MAELQVGDKVFAYHMNQLYEAKVMEKETDKTGDPHYFVHYHGWAKKWDEWVASDRIMPINEETKKLKDKIMAEMKAQRKAARQSSGSGGKKGSSSSSKSGRGGRGGRASGRKRTASETRGSSAAADVDSDDEESEAEEGEEYKDVEAVKLPITYALRRLIVHDWENVTKRRSLVKIPKSNGEEEGSPSVAAIFRDYIAHKEGQEQDDSSLRGFIEGLRLYFDRAIGAFLLYRFERPQYENIVKQQRQIAESKDKEEDSVVEESLRNQICTPEGEPRPLSEIYGAEHLLRLFVKLPQLLIHTKLTKKDHKAFHKKITEFLRFLQKNQNKYFGDTYTKADGEYITEYAKLADTVTVSIPPSVAAGKNESMFSGKGAIK
eukprot:gb/GECG01004753.1/.p1 GENE.gb/GECG01004753.1/~~gb/GECG01004753.1/.p1  ORF type:complete len:377 (+),score=71.08 gb/GECG01004753.1/:1-1131(+)